jgi:hypothetical protein
MATVLTIVGWARFAGALRPAPKPPVPIEAIAGIADASFVPCRWPDLRREPWRSSDCRQLSRNG